MKRRGFLATLAAVTAATAMEMFGAKAQAIPAPVAKRLVMNPAYLNAEYEFEYFFNPKVLKMIPPGPRSPESGTPRYNLEADGTYTRVPMWIEPD